MSAESLFASVLVVVLSLPAAAQNPDVLSEALEGKQVVMKMDMPGTQQGVDIFPGRAQPLDTKRYAGRIKKFGASLRQGEAVMITRIKVKSDNIEVQLGGGGFGTFTDDADTSVHFKAAEKSGREKDLEDQIRTESDPDRRRSLERDLDDVRSQRERNDRRDKAIAERAADAKKQQVADNRQQGGSRFNIRFAKGRSGDYATPEDVVRALAEYVSFTPGTTFPVTTRDAVESESGLKKGMTRDEVEKIFGPPEQSHDETQSGFNATSCTYRSKDETVEAYFVNGVLVRYTVASR